MVPRLPVPGSDAGNWGEILNNFLEQSHNADGTLKNVATPADVVIKADKTTVDALASEVSTKVSSSAVYTKSEIDAIVAQKSDKPLEYLTPVAVFSPNVSRAKTGLITLSKAGAVWDTTLDGAPAWRVMEGTVNTFPDPFFKASPGTYVGINTGGSVATTANTEVMNPLTGGYMGFKAVNDGTAGSQGLLTTVAAQLAAIAGQSVTISVDLAGTVGAPVAIVLSQRDSGGAVVTEQIGPTITLSATPTRYSATFVVSGATVTHVRAKVYRQGAVAAYTLHADRLQVEAKAYATTFCPSKDSFGVVLPGQQWNGTPDASTSTRTNGVISTPIPSELSPYTGSVYVRHEAVPILPLQQTLYNIGQGTAGTDRVYGVKSASAGQYQAITRSNSGTYIGVSANGYPVSGSMTTYHEWTAGAMRARSFNGTFTSTNREPVQGSWGPNPMNIGTGGQIQWGASIAILLAYPRPLTTQELATLDATPPYRLGWETLNPALMSTPFADLLPNRQTTSSVTLRLTPGPAGVEVTVLQGGYRLHDTGQRLVVASVIYALVWTLYGQGWVEENKLGGV